MKQKKIEVIQPKDKEVPVEILATAIKEIADGMKRINLSGLNRRALLVLLKDSSGVSMAEIGKVLDSLAELHRTYTK